MINITKETTKSLQTLVSDAFNLNAQLNRMKSLLLVKFRKPNISKIIHDIAHFYALDMADKIGDLIETYGGVVEYGGIDRHVEDIESFEKIIDLVCEGVLEFQNELNMASKIALSENDIHIFQELLEVIEKHNIVVQDMLLIKDLTYEFKGDVSLDAFIFKYIKGGV